MDADGLRKMVAEIQKELAEKEQQILDLEEDKEEVKRDFEAQLEAVK